MCGICGIIGNKQHPHIETMVAAMHHRGPDDCGMFQEDGIALGMTRLAIIDTSTAAHQPMSTPDKNIWIVYNGEVYNFQTERKLLEAKGYNFRSSSDTEVVLRLYEHYGDDFLLRLRGIFALAIYDKRRGFGHERLLLARDQLGVKPLLYARVGGCLIFASEIKAILASAMIDPQIDPVALRLLLTFGSVYQPRTMLKGVSMLLPAHRLIFEQGQERIERYWSLGTDRFPELRSLPYAEQVKQVSRVLRETVRLQMISDVPLGAFLSGGVDSSVLVALMAQEAGHLIKTFSVGFEAEGAHLDESAEAYRTAQYIGTDHTHVLVRGTEVRDQIFHIAAGLDQPSVDGVNSYFVSLAARQTVTAAVSGTGGDEIFAGYPWFTKMVLYEHAQQAKRHQEGSARGRFKKFLLPRKLLNYLRKRLSPHKNDAKDRSDDFLAQYANQYHIFGAQGASHLLASELREVAHAGNLMRDDLWAIDELVAGSAIERVSGLCLRGYTSNQLLRDIDAVSMAHSLEVRVPYLDPVMVEMALSLPDEAKLGDVARLDGPAQKTYRETGTKRILIDVGKALLPKDFDLQEKRGFVMPFEAWLKGPLGELMQETLSEPQVRSRGLLDVNAVAVVKDQFLGGRMSWPQPWLLMMLELWCREVLDKGIAYKDIVKAELQHV